MKTQLFPRHALPKIFLLFTLITLVILHTAFGLIWTTPWPAEKKIKFSKIRNSRNSQNSVWKPNFFLGALNQFFFCFTLSLHWWYSIPRLVWFGQLLDPVKKIFFKILKISQFAKFAKFRMKNLFFPRRAQPNFFLLFTLISLVILHTAFGLIWTTPWPAEKKLKFSKFRNSRNSQNSVWKPNFFLGALNHFFCFTLSLHWWYSIPRLVWFGQLLDPMKKIFFKILKISQFAKFAKFRMKNLFFPRHALPNSFLLFTLISLVILHTAFGLIWTTPWPAEKKIKILKISQFAKFAKFRMKTQLFPRRAQPFFLLYTLITLVILHTAFGLIWTTP